jgi:preprotein translocase subunit SecA
MDYLREGIHLRGFAQIDPLVAYKNEGFSMFQELMASIWEEFTRVMFHLEVNIEPAQAEEMFAAEERQRERQVAYEGGGGAEQPSAIGEARAAAAAAGGASGEAAAAAAPTAGNGAGQGVNPATVVKTEQEKIGRNDPCWCGSGKKYKKCHGA